jgi:hypothetical protein
MRSKERIATLSKSDQGIRPGQSIEVADAPAPISQVEIMLGRWLRQLSLGVGDGLQLRRSALWAVAASRSG